MGGASPRIMISYRRSDSAGITGRIFDRLAAHFGAGSVFMDIEAIPLGVDFHKYIDDSMKAMDYVLAIIGPGWLGELPDGTSRITNAADPVRLELETALLRGIRVVPVLVEGAKLPTREQLPEPIKSLRSLNAIRIDADIDFQPHVERLIRSLEVKGERRSDPVTFAAERRLDNLPKWQTDLIGRAADVASSEALLQESRIVTVTGSGGVGKTRLVLKVANDLHDSFADGAWFVDLAPIHAPELVANEIASALDVPRSTERPVLDGIVEYLRRRELLLIVDNCEHVIAEVAAALDALLKAAPGIRVLATSREPLGLDGERVYRLPSLAVPESGAELTAANALEFGSIALFAQRAAGVNPNFKLTDTNASVVGDICRQLDGIPLAIELAAARTNVLTPNEIRSRLDERFRVLAGGQRTALPRQQTMRATIDWSFDLLNERERALLRRLAVFVSGFTLEAAVAVGGDAGSDEFAVIDELASLVSKSLVLADSAGDAIRYKLLESTREYALEKLAASPEAASVRKRFAEWCLAFVERIHSLWETYPSAIWISEAKSEFENVRSALEWTLTERNDVLLGQRLAAGARRLWGRVAPVEGKNWLRSAADVIDDATPRETVAAIWLGDAHVHIALREYKRALASAETARKHLADDEPGLAYWEASGFAGFALAMLGRASEAEPLLTETLAAYRRSNARQLTAGALAELAFYHAMRDDMEAARRFFREALDVFGEVRNTSGQANVAINLAEIEFRAGNTEKAIDYGETALTGGDSASLSMYLVNMTAYLTAAGRWDEARRRAFESVSGAGAVLNDIDMAYALQHFAAIAALRSGESEASNDDLRRAAQLLGYVDSRLAALECSRQFTEQFEYDRIVGRLSGRLEPDILSDLRAEGSSWDETRALAAAKLV